MWNLFPISRSLSDEELKELIDELVEDEREVSLPAPILHGKIDILRAELVARLQASGGKSVLDAGRRRQPRPSILAGKSRRRRTRLMSHVYCPECGFQNPEAANYCARCGALLEKERAAATRRRRSRPRRSTDARASRVETASRARRSSSAPAAAGRARRFVPARRAHDDRPLARLRHLPRRRHRLAQARACSSTRDGAFCDRGPGQPQRHVRQPPADRVAPSSRTATSSRSASTG